MVITFYLSCSWVKSPQRKSLSLPLIPAPFHTYKIKTLTILDLGPWLNFAVSLKRASVYKLYFQGEMHVYPVPHAIIGKVYLHCATTAYHKACMYVSALCVPVCHRKWYLKYALIFVAQELFSSPLFLERPEYWPVPFINLTLTFQ